MEPERKAELEEIARTIRRVMYSLLAVSIFCLATLFGPDKAIVPGDGEFQFPFIDTGIRVAGFAIFGPLVLIALNIYLLLFVACFPSADRDVFEDTYIFTMNHWTARLATAFVFFWLVPLVLIVFWWRLLPRPESEWLGLLTAMVTLAGVILQIRVSPPRNIWTKRYVLMPLAAIIVVGLPFTVLHDNSLLHAKSLRNINLFNADLSGRDMENIDLSVKAADGLDHGYGVDMERANLQGAALRGATLKAVNLLSANMRGAYLYGADLSLANLTRAQLSCVNNQSTIRNTVEKNFGKAGGNDRERPTLESCTNLIKSDLSGAVLEGANLNRALLQAATLTEANLKYADLREANLQDADLRNAVFEQAMLQDASLLRARLQDAILEKATMQRADLSKAILSGARMESANLQQAVLEKAQMQSAVLSKANLEGAQMYFVQLEGADLSLAVLKNSSLYLANLIDANLRDSDLQKAELIAANLQRANLENANLMGAKLRGANLQDSNLSKANLRLADLSGANIENANLEEADLREAEFQAASPKLSFRILKTLDQKRFFDVLDFQSGSFKGSELRKADLRGARNLTCQYIETARNWELAYRDEQLACGAAIPERPAN